MSRRVPGRPSSAIFRERCNGASPHRFFPVQLDETAWEFDGRLGGTNFVRAFAEAIEQGIEDTSLLCV